MEYRVVRDDGGYAEAISYGDRHVLRLVIGATRNEEEAERVVEMLNAYEDALNCMEPIAAHDAEWRARVDRLETALKGALREHGSCDWNGCWCQDASAAIQEAAHE